MRPIRFTRIVLISVVILGCSLTLSCSKYGQVSQQASEYAQAVYAVCNRKDAARIESVENQIRVAEASDNLEPYEVEYLLEILKLAREEQWETASANARRLLQEQQRSARR